MSGPGWVLRADASAGIGVGHVVRGLTLAEAASKRGRSVRLLTADLPAPLRARADALGVEVVDVRSEPGSADDGAETAAALPPATEVLVVDGYHLGAAFRRGLGTPPVIVVGIDDNLESDPHDLDVVVNHAPHARPADYQGRAGTALLGPSYALLRSEITALIPVDRDDDRPARRVVVTMGGTDVTGASGPLAVALATETDLDIDVVTGLANPRADELRDLTRSSGGRIRAVDPDDLPDALVRADVGVVAAGGTLWEAAALGLPVVAAVTADNQRRLTDTPDVRSFALVHDLRGDLDVAEVVADVIALAADPIRRSGASLAGTALVDGRGAERVVDTILLVAAERDHRAPEASR